MSSRAIIYIVFAVGFFTVSCGSPEVKEPEVIETVPYCPDTDTTPGEEAAIRYGVYNGCGVSGLGAGVAEEMEIAGYNVTRTGNCADFDRKVTIVYYRDDGFHASALEIAGLYKIPEENVIKSAEYGEVDIALVLGADFTER